MKTIQALFASLLFLSAAAWASGDCASMLPPDFDAANPILSCERHGRELAERSRRCDLAGGEIDIELRREQLKELFDQELFLHQRLVAHPMLWQSSWEAFKRRWVARLKADPEVVRLDQKESLEDRCWLTAQIDPSLCPGLDAEAAEIFEEGVEISGKTELLELFKKTGLPARISYDLMKAALLLELVRAPGPGEKASYERVFRDMMGKPLPFETDHFTDLAGDYFPELAEDSFGLKKESLRILSKAVSPSELRRRFETLNRPAEPDPVDRELIVQYLRFRASADRSGLEPLRLDELKPLMNEGWPSQRAQFRAIHSELSRCRENCSGPRNQEQFQFAYFLLWSALKSAPPGEVELAGLEEKFRQAKERELGTFETLISRGKSDPAWLRSRNALIAPLLQESLDRGDAVASGRYLRRICSNFLALKDSVERREKIQKWGQVGAAAIGTIAVFAAPFTGASSLPAGATAGSTVLSTTVSTAYAVSIAGGVGLSALRYYDSRQDYRKIRAVFASGGARYSDLSQVRNLQAGAGWSFVLSASSIVLVPMTRVLGSSIHQQSELSKVAAAGVLGTRELTELLRLESRVAILRRGIKGYYYLGALDSAARGEWRDAALGLVTGKVMAPGGNSFPGMSVLRDALGLRSGSLGAASQFDWWSLQRNLSP